MRKILFVFILTFSIVPSFANHISGGEMIYEYLGAGGAANTNRYRISLRLFRDDFNANQTGGAQLPLNARIGIFNAQNNALIPNGIINANRVFFGPVSVSQPPPCMLFPPTLEYTIAVYSFEIELPQNAAGYIASFQTCCRINSLFNVFTQSGPGVQGEGSTYACFISGTNLVNESVNSSPQFNTQLTAVCFNSPFTFDFGAIDPDGDSLAFSFCNAYNRGNSINSNPVDPSNPPYQSVVYIGGYSGTNPLGVNATINGRTGIISGISPPSAGNYVVCVCINEYRNGVLIGRHRKDFILTVSSCEIPDAKLIPDGTTCDGFIVSFQNKGSNANVTTWLWLFGDPASGSLDTSRLQNPTHDYTASGAGDYTVKLYVNKGLPCEDSAQAVFKVYPGWQPNFKAEGQCKGFPVQFTDLSVHLFGNVNKWTWNFGDPSSGAANTDTRKNPTHTYTNSGIYKVTLIVESDKGCSTLVPKQIEIKDKPAFTVFPKDTLICKVDDLQIRAVGSGTVVWSPNYNINNVNIPNPIVTPDVTTTYTATFTDAFGCVGTDEVKINVVDGVTQGVNYDTTICTGDAIQLKLFSNALYYTWTPNDGSLNSTTIKNPTAKPTTLTDYVVIGKISNICFAQNTIKVKPVPYPDVVAPDVSVCLGTPPFQLQASGGTIYNWSPRTYLSSTIVSNPTVTNPLTSVVYTLTVRDVLGCPKPVQKLVRLNVIKIKANAGPRDTSVVLGQPLQLNATGGVNFLWLPDNRWLSNTNIHNPIALPQSDIEYIVQVSDNNGCKGLDSIRVKLYKVAPGLYVPNAFTPNGDTKNDFFKPILLGMKSLDLFQVYNRFGQMIYSSTDVSRGWDGTFGGRPQDPASYVWIAEATEYTGKKIKRKGNVILIRQ